MTTPTLDKPPTPAPTADVAATRTPLGRALTWTGAVLGGLTLVWGGLQVADLVVSRTMTDHATYASADVVELVADGRVTVSGTSASSVDVVRTQRGGFAMPTYEVDEREDRLVVRNRCTWWFGTCSGSLDVDLPAGTQVVVRTSNGEVRATGVAGPLDLQTSDGRIEVVRADGDVTLRSSNGAILVNDVEGSLAARTSDGRIDVDDVRGDVEVVTSNGGVQVGRVDGDARVRTSDGRIDVAGIGGSLQAVTSNGGVTVQDVRGDAAVRSSDGGLDVAAVQGNVEAVTSNGHVTVLGTGEPVALTISTSNGQQVVDAPTDPAATRTVVIRSSDGNVAYLGPRGS